MRRRFGRTLVNLLTLYQPLLDTLLFFDNSLAGWFSAIARKADIPANPVQRIAPRTHPRAQRLQSGDPNAKNPLPLVVAEPNTPQ